MTPITCPLCLTPIKLTYHARRSIARGNPPRCHVCNPKCAVCNGKHRTEDHRTDRPVCKVCYDMPWRRAVRCPGCRGRHEAEPAVELEDPMRSHMGRVSDLGGGS